MGGPLPDQGHALGAIGAYAHQRVDLEPGGDLTGAGGRELGSEARAEADDVGVLDRDVQRERLETRVEGPSLPPGQVRQGELQAALEEEDPFGGEPEVVAGVGEVLDPSPEEEREVEPGEGALGVDPEAEEDGPGGRDALELAFPLDDSGSPWRTA